MNRVSSISIKGLFGMFDHEIVLKKEGITIIHGPNGVGKTTVLKMIKDIIDKNFYKLMLIKFSMIDLKFDNEDYIIIRNNIQKEKLSLDFSIKINGKTKEFKLDEIDRKKQREFPLHIIDEVIPQLERTGQQEWFDRSTGDTIGLDEVFRRYSKDLPFKNFSTDPYKGIPSDFFSFLDTLKCHFIQTQRLFINNVVDYRSITRHRVKNTITTIESYSAEMSKLIQETIKQSGSLSAVLDQNFPERLLADDPTINIEESQIRKRYSDQNEYRERLMHSGLIDSKTLVALPVRTLTTHDLKVLWYYLNDVDEKFNVFDGLLGKIELFKEIINSRFKYKKLEIKSEQGFLLISDINEEIPLTSLSSGEQHEIVLAYELIFKVPQDSLILIDEPELSLHVTWQHKFIEDIRKISELASLYFIIATHSPSIIQNKRNLMVQIPSGEKK